MEMKNDHGNIMKKSWNFSFENWWEPCMTDYWYEQGIQLRKCHDLTLFCLKLFFFKNISAMLSECQTVWIQIRTDFTKVISR